jgi:mycothiol synthase
MSIAPFEPATATAAELDGYFQVEVASSAADRPGDPRPTARNAINDAPKGDMALTMHEYTPGRVRDEEARARARRCQLRVVAVIRDQSQEVAGLTYLEVYQSRPGHAVQQDTAVLPAHRGHGLGLW